MNNEEVQKLELFISCRHLKDLDTFTVSDPYVVMHFKNNGKWFEHGRTEKIDNNLNPNFTKSMTIQYHFELLQHLRFEVYHYVDENQSKLIGRVESTLSAIVGSKDQQISLPIYDDKNEKGGIIIIRVDQVKDCSDQITLKLRGNSIIETRFWFWRSTNPFLRFYRLRQDDPNPVLVYETEYVLNNVNPIWKPIVCRAQKLCNGDYNMPIKIELWDYRTSGRHVFIGETTASFEELQNGEYQREFKNNQNGKYKNKVVGILQFMEFKIDYKASFMDFLQGGLQLNLLVAIDFTKSNKNINDVSSLHYQDPNGQPSQYLQAISSVGEILINYDSDKKVPVYGFGCKPKLNVINSNDTLHCFPLNDDPDDPEVDGLDGIINVYKDTIHKLVFDGPTYLHPVISYAMQQANSIKEAREENYLILLILTDGQTNDIDITVNDVVGSSHLPLSIIIVGLGDADFTLMEKLNNNDLSLVDSKGNQSLRDLVQFVPFTKYNGDAKLLSQEVLKELPDQVVEYMELTNQAPKPSKKMKFSNNTINSINKKPPQNQQQKPIKQQQQRLFMQQQRSLVEVLSDDDAQSQKKFSTGMGVNVLSQGMAQTGFLQRIVAEIPPNYQQDSQFNQSNLIHYPNQ